jgi:ubiquinone/menaquinone biosynthesis C-methylase UbiE
MSAWQEESVWSKRAVAYANQMDRLWNTPDQLRKWCLRLQTILGEAAVLDVLDIGTGPGFLAVPLSWLGHRVTGLDFSEDMVRIAAERASGMGLNAAFVQGRADKLPFAEGAFDAVVCRHLLPYVSDRRQALKEWLRILKPGGRMAIWDGDWTARNLAPYAQMQWTDRKRVPRRQGIVKRQGTVRSLHAPASMRDEVMADLLAAGFIDIHSREREDEALSGLGEEALLACEKLVIAARKPY